MLTRGRDGRGCLPFTFYLHLSPSKMSDVERSSPKIIGSLTEVPCRWGSGSGPNTQRYHLVKLTTPHVWGVDPVLFGTPVVNLGLPGRRFPNSLPTPIRT